jgi:hypothetical protein
MSKQVFLGGACGRTSWRQQIAIPALEAAGISYYDPQLGIGEWTEAREAAEMKAKAEAEVLLFVVSDQTRSVASIGEAAYLIASGRPLALAVRDVPEGAVIDENPVTPAERGDLNRGRIFLRTMARTHGVPVFESIPDAVDYAIQLVRDHGAPLTTERLCAILDEVHFKQSRFLVEECGSGFLMQLCCPETDVETGSEQEYLGRKWYIDRLASRSAVVHTAFLAVLTWQEHEARHWFTYRGEPVFGPHSDVDGLVSLARSSAPMNRDVTVHSGH